MGRSKQPPLKGAEVDWWKSTQMDYNAVLALNSPTGAAPYQHLASGRYLHNPAKRRVKDAATWAKQQIDNAIRGSNDWLAGTLNPARDPVQSSIEAETKWRAAIEEAIRKNRRVEGLRRTNFAEMSEIIRAKGASGYESGIRAREAKINEAVSRRQVVAQAISDAIQAMPDATPADREKRLLAARRLGIESKGK